MLRGHAHDLDARRGAEPAARTACAGEARIADLVAEGLSNPDIAAKLYLSRRTVQTHVSNILAKLQVNSRAGIVRAAAEHPEKGTTASA